MGRTCTSFSLSPFNKLCTGMPVAFATTREISPDVTRSCNIVNVIGIGAAGTWQVSETRLCDPY